MEGQDRDEELYPIAVLIDELKVELGHDDVLLRLNAIHRLSTIALALGPERTRDELIPFLDESVEDEDEVLTALSEELGGLVEHVGGPEYAHVLLSPLENLAAIEEPLVREKAVESLNKICKELSQQQVEEYFMPLTVRLSKADWFTSKISGTGLYETPYTKATPPSQEQLRSQFGQLVHDDTPMVRRQAANNMAKFVKAMPASIVIEEMIPLFQHLAGDDQDSVRLLTVEILIAVAEVVPKEQQSSHGVLLNALRSLFEDRSWRVRYMVADRFEKIAKAVDDEVISRDLVPAFIKLLKDTEAEVRSAIAKQIPGFCALVERDTLLNEIMPGVEELVTDSSQHVRAALGSEISGLAPILGKEETISHLLPVFLQMLKDDFPEVRLNIISKLEQVNNVIGIEKLSSSLLPAITTLAEDKQWRVRLAIIEYVPLLASQLGVNFFNNQLNELCMSWLGDTVYSIREASVQNLKKLTEVFGVDWAGEAIIPRVMQMGQHPNYLYRMTTCFAISTLAPVINVPIIETSVLPMLNKLLSDDIPNIRFNVAKSYAVLIDVLRRIPERGTIADLEKQQKAKGLSSSNTTTPKARSIIQDHILPNLAKLQDDDDVDVRYFAMTAAQTWNDEMQMINEESNASGRKSGTPAPASRSRRRGSSSSESEGGRGEANEDTSQQQMVKSLVRLALAHEHARKPIRRADITDKALSHRSRAFKSVFDATQLALRQTFGMEMVELPAKEKVTLKDKRAAQKSQSQATGSSSSKQWIVCSVMPPEYRELNIIGPAKSPTLDHESAYTGLYSFVIATIALAGGQLPQARLDRILARMNADQNTPVGQTPSLLKRIEQQGYIVRVTEVQGGEEVTDYIVGPRGKVELGSEGVAGLVRRVYAHSCPEDLEQRLARSLKVAQLEKEPISTSASVTNGVANAQASGAPKRGRPRRHDNDGED
ncbi:MAG: hypothetical protein Q9162_002896 [Coniocarpon cinnabarinum]